MHADPDNPQADQPQFQGMSQGSSANYDTEPSAPPYKDLEEHSFSTELRTQAKMEETPNPKSETNSERNHSNQPVATSSHRRPDRAMQIASWLLEKAENSNLALTVLNQAFLWAIPFNRPHGIKLTSVKANELQASLPYKRKNMNHLRGLHACALATVSEFTSGVLLARYLDPSKYRIIMGKMTVEYHYQGKSPATAICHLDHDTLQKQILDPISKNGSASYEMEALTYDSEQNHLSTARITWHVKPWENVRTRR